MFVSDVALGRFLSKRLEADKAPTSEQDLIEIARSPHQSPNGVRVVAMIKICCITPVITSFSIFAMGLLSR
ncbi:hypothetical protein RLJV_19370 [Pseudomonas aeruginosa]|nr:hypothetical protein RLJV_19370 [Pseudomonas aeruginosa]